MPDSWNPPTGPPNGAPMHQADAKREIEDAVAASRVHDQQLRARAVALATSRIEAAHRLAVATTEAEDARTLAKRALGRANESARAGQRADATRWTGAAQVFAMRLRDARTAVADAEGAAAAAAVQRQQLDATFGENIGRLQGVAAARLPMLSGRKAARCQALVDEAVAAMSVPVTDLVARAEAEAHAALSAADEAPSDADASEVAVDDLEREVDFASTDDILDELRAELGLPAAGPTSDTDDLAAERSEGPPRPAAGAPDAPAGARDAPAGPRDAPDGAPRGGPDDASPVPHTSGART